MVKYEIICTDAEGDKLKVDAEDGIATIQSATKFTLSVDSNKIKRLVDSIEGISTLLNDYNFKSLEIKKVA